MSIKKHLSRTVRERLVRFCVGIGLCCALMTVYVWQPDFLQQLNRHIYDLLLRNNAGGKPSPTPALLDIDEKSLAHFGQWPWPRHLVGKLVATLTENGAAAIGLDILLAEPDNASVQNLQKSFEQHFDITLPLDGVPQELKDNDKILAAILAQTPSVLGGYVRFTGEKSPLPPLPYAEGIVEVRLPDGISPYTQLMQGEGATLPLLPLRTVAPIGIMNIAPDPDGILRSVPLVMQVDGHLLISLGLRSLMRGLNLNTLTLISGSDGLQALRVGKYTLPVAPDGRFTLAFRGPHNYYPTFSAADILNNAVPREEIEGRIFIVGTSAAGLLDIRATPFDAVYPGAEVHATVIDSILSQRFIEIPFWDPGVQITAIGLWGFLGTLLFSFVPAMAYLPILGFCMAGIGVASWYLFQQGMYFSPLYSLLTVGFLAISILVVRFWQEAYQKRTLRNAFSRYIAPDMVARIVDRGKAVLMGEEREVTILFTDIRGFTTISEGLTPNQVAHLLNQYFTPMTAIIRDAKGTVDKFIGDAVMAFWNAPLDVANHPFHAVHCALKMQAALDKLNVTLEEELDIHLTMGTGLHTGKVYVGNMGSTELLDYTCIGDSVNLAARLESLCGLYGVSLMMSKETVEQYTAIADNNPNYIREYVPYFALLDAIRVKGKTQPIEIYTAVSLEERIKREAEAQAFTQARHAYTEGDFRKALTYFTALQQEFPHVTIYEVYAQRCQNLLISPPAAWDGVWTFQR